MKTLILYSSKTGTTQKCAESIAKLLEGEKNVLPIENIGNTQLGEYDAIIIGSSIYMGKINKSCVNFCQKNIDILCQKRIGLYFCGLSSHDASQTISDNFPQKLVECASAKGFLGGEINLDKLNPLKALIIKTVTSKDPRYKDVDLKKSFTNIDANAIKDFVQVLNQID